MRITTTHQVEVSHEALAEALVESGPEGFAKFWFAFYKVTETRKVDLDALGKAMAPQSGGARQYPLRSIVHAMEAEIYRLERDKT